MNKDVRIARIESDKTLLLEVTKLLSHPVYSVILGFALIELLQQIRISNDRPFLGPVAATSLYELVGASGVIVSLSKGGILDTLLPILIAK